jgi:hypothetical protein
LKKVVMFTLVGAGLGYASAYLMDRKVTVTESK